MQELYKKIWNSDERNYRIGRFFVAIVRWILGAHHASFKKLLHNDKDGDLIHWGLGSYLEVKATDNNHGWRIYVDQLDRHIASARCGFPASHSIYCLVGYKNREHGKRVLEIHGNTQRRLEGFLAWNTTVLYLIDAETLKLLQQIVGVKHDTRDRMYPRPYIPITRTLLNKFAHDPRSILKDAGASQQIPCFLPPRANRIKTVRIATRFRRRNLSLNVVSLLPIWQRRLVRKYLNGTVIGS